MIHVTSSAMIYFMGEAERFDDPGLLALPENLRDEDVRERLKQCSELASEHASTLQGEMKTHYDKNSSQRSLRQVI